MIKKDTNNPILITGSHRSGSTWVGKVIESSGLVNYIGEPLNPGHEIKRNGFWFNHNVPKIWFPAISFLNENSYREGFDKIIKKRFSYFNLKPKNYAQFKYASKLIWKAKKNNRILLKDPIALFSSGWLYEKYNTKNIVLVRNPLAFVSSLKKNNWTHDFNDFMRQDKFIKDVLPEFVLDIQKFSLNSPSIIDQGILFSNIFNYYILQLKKEYPNWYFISLEKIAVNPIIEFEELFNYLNLDFNARVRNYILETTNSKNTAERVDEKVHTLKRNSKESINTWKKRLTKDEVEKIEIKTSVFYNNLLEVLNEKQ